MCSSVEPPFPCACFTAATVRVSCTQFQCDAAVAGRARALGRPQFRTFACNRQPDGSLLPRRSRAGRDARRSPSVPHRGASAGRSPVRSAEVLGAARCAANAGAASTASTRARTSRAVGSPVTAQLDLDLGTHRVRQVRPPFAGGVPSSQTAWSRSLTANSSSASVKSLGWLECPWPAVVSQAPWRAVFGYDRARLPGTLRARVARTPRGCV